MHRDWLGARDQEIIMVYKTSAVWTISAEALKAHLANLTAPDSLYWDSRELKNKGQKFTKMEWSHWPRATKANGAWEFAPAAPAPTPAAAIGAAPAPAIKVVASAPTPAPAPTPAKTADDAIVLAAIMTQEQAVREWAQAGCVQPAPELVLTAKSASGAGWKQFATLASTI